MPPGGGNGKFTFHNCLKRFIPFNGKTQPHQTEAFKGERYTAVFYKTSMSKSSKPSESSKNNNNSYARETTVPDKSSSLFDNFQKLKQKIIKKKRF